MTGRERVESATEQPSAQHRKGEEHHEQQVARPEAARFVLRDSPTEAPDAHCAITLSGTLSGAPLRRVPGRGDGGVLEERATPAQPRHEPPTLHEITDDGAVGSERHVEDRRRVGEHLVADVGAGGDHGVGRQRAHGLGERVAPRLWAVVGEQLVVGDVHDVGPEGTELGGGRRAGPADHQGVHRVTERAGERQRLERGRHDRGAIVLDEHQDHAVVRPASASERPGDERVPGAPAEGAGARPAWPGNAS